VKSLNVFTISPAEVEKRRLGFNTYFQLLLKDEKFHNEPLVCRFFLTNFARKQEAGDEEERPEENAETRKMSRHQTLMSLQKNSTYNLSLLPVSLDDFTKHFETLKQSIDPQDPSIDGFSREYFVTFYLFCFCLFSFFFVNF
jgi:hypothetical protein